MMKRSVMLVSPRGSRVKGVRTRIWFVITLFLMTAVGITGYFVPFDKFFLTEREVVHKRGLEEQNASLQRNIGATLRTLTGLKERVGRLEVHREQHRDIIGLPHKPAQQSGSMKALTAPTPSALRGLGENEETIANFAIWAGGGRGNVFDTIPVIPPVASGSYVISRRYGMDRDPFTGQQKMHYGTDFAAELGVPVNATAAGVVARVESDPLWGRRVTIAHGRSFRTVYAHLGTVRVAQGKAVKRGEEIGTVGMSGLTTGTHVHYEIWHRDRAVNPEEYLFPMMVTER